jgi:hypothetical protein
MNSQHPAKRPRTYIPEAAPVEEEAQPLGRDQLLY